MPMNSLLQGLKMGGLMNESYDDEKAFRKGRHHFMISMRQLVVLELAFEQLEICLNLAKLPALPYSWYVGRYIVPFGISFLASKKIQNLPLSRIIHFIQDHVSDLSLMGLIVSSIGLLALGRPLLGATTLISLSVGIANRHNLFSKSAQKLLRRINFYIGNIAGVYLTRKGVTRYLCALNLGFAVADRYFPNNKHKINESTSNPQAVQPALLQSSGLSIEEEKAKISLEELSLISPDATYLVDRSHVHRHPLPSVKNSVKVTDLLKIYDNIEWSKHEHIITKKLEKDKHWIEKEQFYFKPLEYFDRNFKELVKSIDEGNILEGQLTDYAMLEFYCRFIAQQLQEENEMTQADMLIWIGVEAGNYCGTGKFGIVEEVYKNLVSQAEGLPLEMRVLACEEQERQRLWQNIYSLYWKMSPSNQLLAMMMEMDSVHSMNLFLNLFRFGEKFGIPHEAAKNDRAANIDPVLHHLAALLTPTFEKAFWEGIKFPLTYFKMEYKPDEWWCFWKWIHLKNELVKTIPYDGSLILERLREAIGSPQIDKFEIYAWWQEWVERQTDLTDEKKSELIEELQAVGGGTMTFNGQIFEKNGIIQDEFLIVILIEMGILQKPF